MRKNLLAMVVVMAATGVAFAGAPPAPAKGTPAPAATKAPPTPSKAATPAPKAGDTKPVAPGPMADAHAGGWDHYLGRLVVAAGGGDPGPDPFATSRVPTAAELRSR